MKTKNLIDAFGAIDEDIFAKAEINPSDDIESYPETPVTAEGRKSLKPIFVGAMGIAAAIAVAVALPMLSDGKTDYPPFEEETSDTESTEEIYNKPELSQWELEHGCRLLTETGPLNAAEIYSVTETVLTAGDAYSTDGAAPDFVAASSRIPAYIDGDSFYYVQEVIYDPISPSGGTGGITLNLNGENYTLLEDSPRQEKRSLTFSIQGVYNGALYYFRSEYGGDGAADTELCRIDITDPSNPVSESICPAATGRCVQSGAYLYFSHYTEEGAFIYRYEMVTGELEIFKKNAEYPSPYQGGLIYLNRDDFSVYRHYESYTNDALLFKFADIRGGDILQGLDTSGGNNISYNYSVHNEENDETGFGFGIVKNKAEGVDIIEGIDSGYILNSHDGDTDVGLIGLMIAAGMPGERVENPLIFDSQTMSIAELYIEENNFNYINSPSDCICVAGYNKDGDVKIYTVRRKAESAIKIEYELLCGNKTLQKAAEKYNVTVSSDFDETMREKLRIYSLSSSFIDGNDIFYTVDAPQEYMYDDPDSISKTACIYRSSMDGTSGAELLLEEAPRIEGWGLYIKLIGVIDNYLYYERKELYAYPDYVGENGLEFESELRRINLSNNTNEMIVQIETTDYDKYMANRYAISGNNIYIAEMYFEPDKLYRIRRYNTVTGETELFKAGAYDMSSFKDGIIYHLIDENAFYYHNDKDNTDSYLFDYPFGYSMFPPSAFGGDVIAVNHDNYIGIMEEKDGVYTERRIIETSSSVNASAFFAPCKGFIPLASLPIGMGRAPVFYDEENDWFAEIIGIEEDVGNWNWIRSSEDTLCLAVFDDEQRVEKIYTVRKR